MATYHPEKYWTEVAERISDRGDGNEVAGDDEPFYRYKRQQFLDMLATIQPNGKSVMELGSGPGGNLNYLAQFNPQRMVGADISQAMVELATENTKGQAEIVKIDGERLPFEDSAFDIVFSATVLQHNSDPAMMQSILREMCRVSANQVFLFERIENTRKGDDECVGRPVHEYVEVCSREGFTFDGVEYMDINASYYVSGAIRKGLNPRSRREGEPLNGLSNWLQTTTLKATRHLDRRIPSKRDVAKLSFHRDQF